MACQPVEMLVSPPASFSSANTVASMVGVLGGVVDDAGVLVAFDVVDVGLVHGPGVDEPFGPVGLVVDRTAVEAEGLGEPVVGASIEPRSSRRSERVVGRLGQEGADGVAHCLSRLEAGGVGGVDAGCVGLDDLDVHVRAVSGLAPAAPARRACQQRRSGGHHPSHRDHRRSVSESRQNVKSTYQKFQRHMTRIGSAWVLFSAPGTPDAGWTRVRE